MKGLIFVYVLTYGGAVVSIFRPFYGFLIYVGFALIRPEAMWGFSLGGGGGMFSRIVAIALLVGWALNGFGNWQFGRSKSILYCLFAFWVWSLASAFQAVTSTDAAMDEVESYGKILIAFLAGLTLIESPQQLKMLAWVIIAATGYMAFEFNTTYWFSEREFIAQEWTYASLDNNGIAITMVASAGLAFFMGLSSARWWQMLLCLAAAAFMVHVVLFSMSRGGMLALIVTGIVSFLIIPKRPIYLVLFGLAVIVALRLAGAEVWERFGTTLEKDASAESRIDLWTKCIEVTLEHPLLGIGPNNWILNSREYMGLAQQKAAHTLWLSVGAEMGVPGLAFLLLFYFICIARLLRYVREKTPVADPWFHGLSRMVIASVIGFMVSAQFVSVQAVELPYFIVLLGAALLKIQDLQTSPATAVVQQPAAAYQPARRPALAARPYPYPI